MEHKAELDNLVQQMSILMEKVETITGDAVIKTRAEIMQQYNDGKVNQWQPDEAITAWAELEALAVAEEAKIEAPIGDDVLVSSPVDDAIIDQAETGRGE
ncbi:hypothetical protein ACOSP7_028896 [Xanthoceras sorbifolium]